MKKRKAIVIAGSRGVGKSIAGMLKLNKFEVIATSSKQVDTSEIKDVENFIDRNKLTDVLVLNTGGPPPKKLQDITKKDWIRYFNQLFLSFALLLQNIKVKKNGYVFLISSYYIKEPNKNMVLSNAFRTAFSAVLKSYGQENLKNNITTINLALGPIYTDRLKSMNPNKTKKQIGENLPLGRVGDPSEIADIVESIIQKEVKYLNCQTLFVDGGISNTLF